MSSAAETPHINGKPQPKPICSALPLVTWFAYVSIAWSQSFSIAKESLHDPSIESLMNRQALLILQSTNASDFFIEGHFRLSQQ